MKMKKTTRQLVIEHIANNGAITRAEALFHYKIQNLMDVIMRLRNEGWMIKRATVNNGGFKETHYHMTAYSMYCAQYEGALIFNDNINRYEAPFEC